MKILPFSPSSGYSKNNVINNNKNNVTNLTQTSKPDSYKPSFSFGREYKCRDVPKNLQEGCIFMTSDDTKLSDFKVSQQNVIKPTLEKVVPVLKKLAEEEKAKSGEEFIFEFNMCKTPGKELYYEDPIFEGLFAFDWVISRDKNLIFNVYRKIDEERMLLIGNNWLTSYIKDGYKPDQMVECIKTKADMNIYAYRQ